jgi:hypothetical protein
MALGRCGKSQARSFKLGRPLTAAAGSSRTGVGDQSGSGISRAARKACAGGRLLVRSEATLTATALCPPARTDLPLATGSSGGTDARLTKPAEGSGTALVDASSAGCPANSSGRRMALRPRLAAGGGSARRPLRSRQRSRTQGSKLRLLSWLNAPRTAALWRRSYRKM